MLKNLNSLISMGIGSKKVIPMFGQKPKTAVNALAKS
jgi:hypothetical protein